MRSGKAIHLGQRVSDDAYILSQYPGKYRGRVEYYRMADNLHTLSRLKWIMELSLVKTLAHKFKTTCQKIYQHYRATIETRDGTYKVLQVTVERDGKPPLITHFGGVCLRWNKWVKIDDNQANHIWKYDWEVVQGL
ncbi:hypothetical protein MiSe_89920 [Microseira wollei NIES-4236]|uniref:Domain X domain-containing protein n=1 Tax=Microseira wollei NIES-4236 TaxID=2530354 RepID=A0AAV3XQU4_9CYAN|nr:group II intron reverse transcriptase/maturase [Microseira wollei]GET44166.1 hypothetical protein MiSe_89920 [Microseira wollei NIES-4236]